MTKRDVEPGARANGIERQTQCLIKTTINTTAFPNSNPENLTHQTVKRTLIECLTKFKMYQTQDQMALITEAKREKNTATAKQWLTVPGRKTNFSVQVVGFVL